MDFSSIIKERRNIRCGAHIQLGFICCVQGVDFLNDLRAAAGIPLVEGSLQTGLVDLAADILGAGIVQNLDKVAAALGVM